VFNLLQKSLIILSPVLNADSDGTVDASIVRTPRAIEEKTGHFVEFDFHQPKMSKSLVGGIRFSSK
jgi:hypothetical protein